MILEQLSLDFSIENIESPSVAKGRRNNEPEAHYMALHSQPYSDAATLMVFALGAKAYDKVGLGSRPTKKFQFALGAMVADLFKGLSYSPSQPCRRHMTPNSFTDRPVGYKAFLRALKVMKEAGFVEVVEGTWFRNTANGEGRLTTIAAKAKLLRFALAHGITPATHGDHFKTLPRPKSIPDPIKISRKRVSFKGVKQPKSVMIIANDDFRAQAEAKRVNRLNAYFAQHIISPDLHYAFQRQFHDGDVPGFDWNMGGRLYSLGGSYQQMPTKDEGKGDVLRHELRINGHSTVEIDIGASHLRILYAEAGQPLDPAVDPYVTDAFPRDVVKDFVTMTLGHTGFQRAWSPRKKEWYADPKIVGIDLQKTYPIANVRKAVLDHLPLLEGWKESPIRWQQLQFIESEVIIECMEILAFEHDVPALPVHDSIIVPAQNEALAMEVLAICFHKHVGATPMLKVKRQN